MPVIPDTESETNLNYRTAFSCGAIPLATGTSIFLLWLVTHWLWLMAAGMFTIYLGTIFAFFGMAALYRYWSLAIPAGVPRHLRNLRGFMCLSLLLVNFPVAAGMTFAAIDIETTYRVTIWNDSAKSLENVELAGPGCEERIGTIPPGRTVRRKLRFQGDGPVILHADINGETHRVTLHGYVSSNFGGSCLVTGQRDGSLTVSPPVP